MKQKIQFLLLLAISCLVLSCQEAVTMQNNEVASAQSKSEKKLPKEILPQEASKTDIYTKAAIETCNCMQPMVEKAKHLIELETNKQTTDMKIVANEMNQIQPQIQKCSDAIRRKYDKIDNSAADEQRIMNALMTECPDMAMLFSNFSKIEK